MGLTCANCAHWCAIFFLCRHYYSKAVQANPYHAVAHFNLGLLLHDEDIETAMEHYQVPYSSVAVFPASVRTCVHAAWSYPSPDPTSRNFSAGDPIRIQTLFFECTAVL